VDRVIAEKFGRKVPSRDQIRAAEERLHARLSGKIADKDKVPVDQRPEPHATPICPIDAVPLKTVSVTDSLQPATRKCPVCKRTEREFMERGIDLTPQTERIREGLNHAGFRREYVKPRW
jgi:hypothetical protein